MHAAAFTIGVDFLALAVANRKIYFNFFFSLLIREFFTFIKMASTQTPHGVVKNFMNSYDILITDSFWRNGR